MMSADIAAIGRRHLAEQLTGALHSCEVSEWLDDSGQPVKVYWRPLTGVQQKLIDAGQTESDRICLTVKHRALDAQGGQIFANTPLESLLHDYDFNVLRALAYIIAADIGQDADDRAEAAEQE